MYSKFFFNDSVGMPDSGPVTRVIWNISSSIPNQAQKLQQMYNEVVIPTFIPTLLWTLWNP